jgi:protein O-GlcNAc transferase
MSIPGEHLARLLEQINGGAAALALPEIDRLLVQQPGHPGALALRAEALRLNGRPAEAIEAFREAGARGAGARNWLAAGILLAAERKTDDALKCLLNALEESPDNPEVLDALITSLFNANRQQEGIGFARRQLAICTQPTLLSRAALLLQSNDLYEESSNAFKKIIQLGADDPALIGAALVPARFTCEWEWIESLQRKIEACYRAGDFGAPQEYPLTHLTWCTDEARNLEVTRAYVKRMVPAVESLPGVPRRPPGARIRIGYLSCDFRNHATMHLMAGLFECHDRSRFEVFAYDYSNFDISEYRQRFLDAVEHDIPIHTMSDRQAAERIADDGLDVLVDLKLYTGGGRSGILAYRPARLQVAYLGFPGSAASPHIDYIVSDRFVTPDSSSPHYTEKFCRLPHSYQCNDRRRAAAAAPGTRAQHGLPDDKVVFGAFNQTYKVDRGSFAVWLRVLAEVPDSVLWVLGQSQAAIANLSRHAQQAGIDPARLIFAPFAAPQEHLARLRLADAVLDALVCNGHTTTSDALWAGVPVITVRGRHFASRVSESLLQAMALPELVGADPDDMVRIARRIGTDASYRAELRARVAALRAIAPLFDTTRFARNFEHAIELLVRQDRAGIARVHIEVPDVGPASAAGGPMAAAAPASVPSSLPASAGMPLQAPYDSCPLCAGGSVTLGFANAAGRGLWHEPLPRTIEWMRCPTCGHVHNRHYWTPAGFAELHRAAAGATTADPPAAMEAERASWAPVVRTALGLLGGHRAVMGRSERPIWVDVGCGSGVLMMTAGDFGFAAVGLDSRADVVARLRTHGFNALQHEFMQLKFEVVLDVLSLTEVLEQMPDPLPALRKAAQILRPGGVLIVRTPDLGGSGWKLMEAQTVNPYWTDLARHHLFTRVRLLALLQETGFDVADLALPDRGRAQIELYALRRP